jgi:hypothetical protein
MAVANVDHLTNGVAEKAAAIAIEVVAVAVAAALVAAGAVAAVATVVAATEIADHGASPKVRRRQRLQVASANAVPSLNVRAASHRAIVRAAARRAGAPHCAAKMAKPPPAKGKTQPFASMLLSVLSAPSPRPEPTA